MQNNQEILFGTDTTIRLGSSYAGEDISYKAIYLSKSCQDWTQHDFGNGLIQLAEQQYFVEAQTIQTSTSGFYLSHPLVGISGFVTDSRYGDDSLRIVDSRTLSSISASFPTLTGEQIGAVVGALICRRQGKQCRIAINREYDSELSIVCNELKLPIDETWGAKISHKFDDCCYKEM